MAKRKPGDLKSRRSSSESARVEADARQTDASWFAPGAIRETVESVIIAFVLAFLFRTFEAEAFVIPTGSMAPTLMGKHKDLECPMCHFRYQVSASDNQESNEPAVVCGATCPMCRYTADLSTRPGSDPSYDGDRILVAKFPYEFADPKRWDVIVFKFPDNATMNYIKRLVGLPGETIRIRDGNLWIKPDKADGRFEIARKPPAKILAMLQLVYNNDLAPTISGELQWPARWTADARGADSAWTNGKDLASFEIEGSARGEAWIRYHHRVPTFQEWNVTGRKGLTRQQWLEFLKTNKPPAVSEQLISDATAYNSGLGEPPWRVPSNMIPPGSGQHWVGDLALQFDVESKSASGKLVGELIRGGCHFQCRIDLATGKAELAISRQGLEADAVADREADRFHPTAMTPMVGAGRHSIVFSNVDDELRLWVDGTVVPFDSSTTYDSAALKTSIPTVADLSPLGIGTEGAALKVSHIKVLRDVYYIAVNNKGLPQRLCPPPEEFESLPNLANPEDWPSKFAELNLRPFNDIVLKPHSAAHPEKDQFFVLGDNSAESADGRLWGGEQWVERELLIGKALFIYWPHGWQIPYLPLPVNVVPYFQRMRLVR